MMKIFAVFFEDNLAAVRRLCDGKTRLNSVMETCITASVSLSPSSEKNYQNQESCKNNCNEDLCRECVSFIRQRDSWIVAVEVSRRGRDEMFVDCEQEHQHWGQGGELVNFNTLTLPVKYRTRSMMKVLRKLHVREGLRAILLSGCGRVC